MDIANKRHLVLVMHRLINIKYLTCALVLLAILINPALTNASCYPNVKRYNDYEPVIFNDTNNLLYRYNQKARIFSEPVIISGILMDQTCKPIPEAKIYIWQQNSSGKYPYQPLKIATNKRKFVTDSAETFIGSGMATTDNHGVFYFVTIYPNKPINVRVEHFGMNDFQTTLDILCSQDPQTFIMQNKSVEFMRCATKIVIPAQYSFKLP